MSLNYMKVALEEALDSMTPSIDTAWENWPYTPITGVPYQKVNHLIAQPDNTTYGPAFIEQGIFQVTLMYPLMSGTAEATARAEMLRDKFIRGAAFTFGGSTVVIHLTPEIAVGRRDEDRWSVPVKIRWHS